MSEDLVPIVDARRALGRRPGGLPPPRLLIDDTAFEDVTPSPILQGPPSPTNRHVSALLPPSDALPSPTLPRSPVASKRFRRPTLSRPKQPAPSTRGLYETQKLLSHLLDKLEARQAAPDLLDRSAVSARDAAGRRQGKGKGKAQLLGQAMVAAAQATMAVGSNGAGPSRTSAVSSEDFEDVNGLDDGDFDTEQVYELVEQTRGLLVLADKQGLDLFSAAGRADSHLAQDARKSKSKMGRLSSLASPSSPSRMALHDTDDPLRRGEEPTIAGFDLLRRLLNCLKTIIGEEGVHKAHRFRPLCPPNALQAACLDIAAYLFHKCGPSIQTQVTSMVIEAFYTFPIGMTERLCEWLEGRMGELLARLAKERGGYEDTEASAEFLDPFAQQTPATQSIPTFSISTDDPLEVTSNPTVPQGWMQYSPNSPMVSVHPISDTPRGIVSPHAPTNDLSKTATHVAGLVAQAIEALTANVDIRAYPLTTIYRLHRLVSLMITAKPDCYVDLLEISALGTSQSSRVALELLNTYYPQMLGHNTVARRLATVTYGVHYERWSTGQDRVLGEDESGQHHYIPWRISSKGATTDAPQRCGICSSEVHGYSIRCTLCKDTIHLHCYRPERHWFVFDLITLSSRNSAPTSASIKFSECPAKLDDLIVNAPRSGSTQSTRRTIGQHDLCLVNIFNLTPCTVCREPLWGSYCQAMACRSGCQALVHPACAEALAKIQFSECRYSREIVVDEVSAQGRNPFHVTSEVLQASFDRVVKPICLRQGELVHRTYDEIAILYGALWTQYQLFKNGLASGSLVVDIEKIKRNSDMLGLKATLKDYEEELHARTHPDEGRPERLGTVDTAPSTTIANYASFYDLTQIPSQGYLFDAAFLQYVRALLRSPTASAPSVVSDGHLIAEGSRHTVFSISDRPDYPSTVYESLRMSTVIHTLQSDLGIQYVQCAAILLEQLRVTGAITAQNSIRISSDDVRAGTSWISFGLPSLMDAAPTVELLLINIERMLLQLDLTLVEQGFRLLCGGCWPSCLCSDYALERLGRAVVTWQMNLDNDLHEVIKEYASKNKQPPGVRPGSNNKQGSSWVSAYQDARSALLARHAHPWLRALHAHDADLYAHVVYEAAKSSTGLPTAVPDTPNGQQALAIQIATAALDRISKVVEAEAVFSMAIDILAAWLEDLGELASLDVVYKALPKLVGLAQGETSSIWELVGSVTGLPNGGLERGSRWMRVMAVSGVAIPWSLIDATVNILSSLPSTVARYDLIVCLNANSAAIDLPRQAEILSRLFNDLASSITSGMDGFLSTTEDESLQYCMLGLLKVYGVNQSEIESTSLKAPGEASKVFPTLTKRRRLTGTETCFKLEPRVLDAVAALLHFGSHTSERLLDFVWLLLSKSNHLSDVEGFIHQHRQTLYATLWMLLDREGDHLARSRLMVRLLMVNSGPFEDLVKQTLLSHERNHTIENLLKFALEFSDPDLGAVWVGRRRYATGVLRIMLDALLDPAKTNSTCQTILEALLPSQMAAISACFEDLLVQSTDEERQATLTRLSHLQRMMPTWPVLSWRAIESLLGEVVANAMQLTPPRSGAHRPTVALLDAQLVRAQLLSIGLHMLASGVDVDWLMAQRFQQHVASACVLPWPDYSDGLAHLVLPGLRIVLDSSLRIQVGGAVSSKSRKTTLVGAAFVHVVLPLASLLSILDLVGQKYLLDILMITFFKHSVRPVELDARKAIICVAAHVAEGACSEHRLLGLQIVRTAFPLLSRDSVAQVAPIVFAIVARPFVLESKAEGDAAVSDSCGVLLRDVIRRSWRSGMFLTLLEEDARREDSSLFGECMARLVDDFIPNELDEGKKVDLMRGIISDLSECTRKQKEAFAGILKSLRVIVCAQQKTWSEGATQDFGALLGKISKHLADFAFGAFGTEDLLEACGKALELAPATSSLTLLHQVSTLLHLTLCRFDVSTKAISSLLSSSDIIARENKTENTVRAVLSEICGSAMHGMPTMAVTMRTIFENLLNSNSENTNHLPRDVRLLVEAAPGSLDLILRRHPTTNRQLDPEIAVDLLSRAARVLLLAENGVAGVLPATLAKLNDEPAPVQLRAYTTILYASLESTLANGRGHLLSLYPVIARVAHLCLRASSDYLSLQDTGGEGAEMLSGVFALFRLAVLAVNDPDTNETANSLEAAEAQEVIWVWTWPEWERQLALSFEPACINTPLRAVVHSVFLDMILFLSAVQGHCALITRHGEAIDGALSRLAKWQQVNGTTSSKVVKARAALEAAGITAGPVDTKALIAVIRADLVATERLKSLRAQMV